MNPEQENFEALRRLLALKRHEQPPPGYFNNFSRQIVTRLRAGERAEEASRLERLLWEAPWLRRVWTLIETKPILVGAFGAAVCALLLSGLNYAENGGATSPTSLLPLPDAPQTAQSAEASGDHSALSPLLTRADGIDFANTGGVLKVENRSSLFQDQKPWVVPASYQAVSGN